MDQKLTDDQLTREEAMDVARRAGQETMRQTGEAAESATATARRALNRSRAQATEFAGETMEQARTMARQAGDTAQDLARRARDQMDPLYQQGVRAGEIISRNVNDYPLAALLVAGMIGYMVAFLIHRSWQQQ